MSQTILIADDSKTVRTIVKMAFKASDYVVEEQGNGTSVVATIQAKRPDVLILDYFMPDADGYELCRQLRQHPATFGLPIVMLGGTYRQFNEGLARTAGADAILMKPFNTDSLLDSVEHAKEVAKSREPTPAQPVAPVAPAASPQRTPIQQPVAESIPPVSGPRRFGGGFGTNNRFSVPARPKPPTSFPSSLPKAAPAPQPTAAPQPDLRHDAAAPSTPDLFAAPPVAAAQPALSSPAAPIRASGAFQPASAEPSYSDQDDFASAAPTRIGAGIPVAAPEPLPEPTPAPSQVQPVQPVQQVQQAAFSQPSLSEDEIRAIIREEFDQFVQQELPILVQNFLGGPFQKKLLHKMIARADARYDEMVQKAVHAQVIKEIERLLNDAG